MKKSEEIKKIVKEKYREIASQESSCSCGWSSKCGDMGGSHNLSKSIGYSEEELKIVGEANMGLGCGNPVAFSEIKKGDTVLDLGSGAGIDCFLAAKKVGRKGKVIGLDIVSEMIEKASVSARKKGFKNIEFKLGEIESIPLEDKSVDIIISNCVINLVPDKDKAMSEVYRVLKKGGKIFISDIVLLVELPEELKDDQDLLAGCVGGALMKNDYLDRVKKAGFKVEILSEDKEISKRQYQGIALESLMIKAIK